MKEAREDKQWGTPKDKHLRRTVGDNIKNLRLQLRLSQSEFGTKIGVNSDRVISSYERGDRMPPIEVLRNITLVGKVSLDWLIPGAFTNVCIGNDEELNLVKAYRGASLSDKEVMRDFSAMMSQRASRLSEYSGDVAVSYMPSYEGGELQDHSEEN